MPVLLDFSRINSVAWTVILATLPLCFLARLPDQHILMQAFFCTSLFFFSPSKWIRAAGVFLLLASWALLNGQIMLSHIEKMTQNVIDVRVKIMRVIPNLTDVDLNSSLEAKTPKKPRLIVSILEKDGRTQFPSLYATLSLEKARIDYANPQQIRRSPANTGRTALPGDSTVYNTSKSIDIEWCAGQEWRMRVRFRPVHASLNEGGFDAQRAAIANRMPLQGQLLSAQPLSLHCSWRDKVIKKIQAAYQHLPWHSVISALAFGDRSEMSLYTRDILRDTGTAHLLAISGMHIGLAALFGHLLVRLFQGLLPARHISHSLPLLVGTAIGCAYTWLSGSSPPSLRAMTALLLWYLIRRSGLYCSGWQIWGLCVGILLFIDPLTILSDSFWLSVIAVAALLFWYQWFPLPAYFSEKKRWLFLRLLHLQIGIMILLLPLQCIIFRGVSLTALQANMLAIPIISFITVPTILTAIILPSELSSPFWWLSDRSLEILFSGLSWLPKGWMKLDESTISWIFLIYPVLIFYRLGWLKSAIGTLSGICFAVHLWRINEQTPEWRLDMLDVGQGLSVVISQGKKAILYDTGNRWITRDGTINDSGKQVLIPWLHWKGITPEQIVVSHKHLDHTGGLESLKRAWPTVNIRSALGQLGHLPCEAGESWQWQGLYLRVLWPLAGNQRGENNDSCVLMVDDGSRRVLLTGDLEAAGEAELVARYRDSLHVTILQVPHHGSRTSSTPLLLRTLKAEAALASVSRYNIWRLPSESVKKRYNEQGIAWYESARSGQISVQFFPTRFSILTFRDHLSPRWYHQWFGNR